MIIGIGTDILQISRLTKCYGDTEGRISERILGDNEIMVFQNRLKKNTGRAMSYLATRFVAKEAFAKAMNFKKYMITGWKSVQILNDETGQPKIYYQDILKSFVEEKKFKIHISISDERDMAIAYVVISK